MFSLMLLHLFCPHMYRQTSNRSTVNCFNNVEVNCVIIRLILKSITSIAVVLSVAQTYMTAALSHAEYLNLPSLLCFQHAIHAFLVAQLSFASV